MNEAGRHPDGCRPALFVGCSGVTGSGTWRCAPRAARSWPGRWAGRRTAGAAPRGSCRAAGRCGGGGRRPARSADGAGAIRRSPADMAAGRLAAGRRRRHGRAAPPRLRGQLLGLALGQQHRHLVGGEQPGQAEVLLLLGRAGLRAAVPNEAPSKITWSSSAVADSASKRFVQLAAGVLGLLRPLQQLVVEPVRVLAARRARGRAAASISLASPSRCGTLGRNTLAVSPGRRARTNRPIAWAKYSGVEALVAYTPTDSRGMSTPSDTIRTATSQRSLGRRRTSAIRADAPASSESTTTAFSPVIRSSSRAYARAVCLVAGDDQAAGVGHAAGPQHLQAGVGGPQHLRHPVAGRVQRGTPRLRDQVLASSARRGGRPARRRRWCASGSRPSRPGRCTGRTTPSRSASA